MSSAKSRRNKKPVMQQPCLTPVIIGKWAVITLSLITDHWKSSYRLWPSLSVFWGYFHAWNFQNSFFGPWWAKVQCFFHSKFFKFLFSQVLVYIFKSKYCFFCSCFPINYILLDLKRSPIFFFLIKEINHPRTIWFWFIVIHFHASVLINSFVIFILLMLKPYYFNSMRNTDIHKLIFYGQIKINILYVLSFYIQLWFSKLNSFVSTSFVFMPLTNIIILWPHAFVFGSRCSIWHQCI